MFPHRMPQGTTSTSESVQDARNSCGCKQLFSRGIFLCTPQIGLSKNVHIEIYAQVKRHV